MNLAPLIHAPFAVQAHVVTVVPAFLLGIWLLGFSRKGARWHRVLGTLFLTLMVTTAVITLFIHRRMPESPVFGLSRTHLFVPLVLFATWRALDGASKGNIKQHQRWVMGLFFGALVINGVNNVFFLPGITHDVFFGRSSLVNRITSQGFSAGADAS
jgi:uncharacterized membrane protein